MTLHLSFQRGAVLAAVCAVGISTASAQERGQFRGMDQNGDGVITRAEWRGNDRSFRNHDLNGDGVITREEMRIAENRSGTLWTSQDFDVLDRNGDDRLSRYEWRSGYGVFDTVDQNRDGVITRAEFLGARDREDMDNAENRPWTWRDFDVLDRDGDNRLSRYEWRSGYGVFDAVDQNRDGVITRAEFLGARDRENTRTAENRPWTSQEFDVLDRDGDNRLSRYEWRPGYGMFDTVDRNRDGFINRAEFLGAREPASATYNPSTQDRSAAYNQYGQDRDNRVGPGARAYQAGRDRGLQDGRRAGSDDRNRGRWDLDGQRELMQADFGYRNEFGDHDIYQAGYREGFMIGYREAFGRGAPGQGRAYQAGREQGMLDGRRAGREDASRGHWDFEGQRELVMADGGYQNGVGSRSEYEWGYREGFRVGYREGFDNRR